MTIAISLKVGEGLVYAADSTSSLFDSISGVDVLVQSYHHAQKLIQVRDLPIGVLTYGLALIGNRNVESLVAEYQSEVLGDTTTDHQVREVAQGLLTFMAQRYDQELVPPSPDPLTGTTPPDNRPRLGITIGGYSRHKFRPEEYSFELPSHDLNERGEENGGLWWGQTTAIARLVLGFDANPMAQWLLDNGVDSSNVHAILGELRDKMSWRIHFDAMPLQDAIDLSVFLANVAIGHSRFVPGPPVCGGHVDVATISHRGFEWVNRKAFLVKSESVFF